MQKTSFILAGLLSAASIGLVGCDVQKTQEGNVTLPKYDVQKTQEGSAQLPKYDVTTPDVKVSKVEKDVTVPKVTTEKETVTLPKVEVTPAPDRDDHKDKK